MKKILYKVLQKDMASPFQNFRYEIDKEYYCKDFDTDKKVDCSRGYYATEIEGLPYTFRLGMKIFSCEVWGRAVEIDQYKRRYSHITLLEEIAVRDVKSIAVKIEKEIGYKLSEVLFPYNPLNEKTKLLNKHKDLLNQWASVRASVGASIWDSVRDSIGASVGASIWASIWNSVKDSVWASIWASIWASVKDSVKDSIWNSVKDSVGASVWNSVKDSVGDSAKDSVGASIWASVGAYISGLFPNIEIWKYVKHEEGKNPFQPCIDLWYGNIVPSFDGKTWRLHSGKKADVIYEVSK